MVPPVDAQHVDAARRSTRAPIRRRRSSTPDPVQCPSCGPLDQPDASAARIRCAAPTSPRRRTRAAAASSCASNATLACSTASDCPSSAPICCAKMTLVADATSDLPPKCTATAPLGVVRLFVQRQFLHPTRELHVSVRRGTGTGPSLQPRRRLHVGYGHDGRRLLQLQRRSGVLVLAALGRPRGHARSRRAARHGAC